MGHEADAPSRGVGLIYLLSDLWYIPVERRALPLAGFYEGEYTVALPRNPTRLLWACALTLIGITPLAHRAAIAASGPVRGGTVIDGFFEEPPA